MIKLYFVPVRKISPLRMVWYFIYNIRRCSSYSFVERSIFFCFWYFFCFNIIFATFLTNDEMVLIKQSYFICQPQIEYRIHRWLIASFKFSVFFNPSSVHPFCTIVSVPWSVDPPPQYLKFQILYKVEICSRDVTSEMMTIVDVIVWVT